MNEASASNVIRCFQLWTRDVVGGCTRHRSGDFQQIFERPVGFRYGENDVGTAAHSHEALQYS